jgi:hypothetical protein
MLVKDLKEWLNKLPEEMDEFVVVTREVKKDEEDETKFGYKDSPLVSGIPDNNLKRLVLHDHVSQLVVNEMKEKMNKLQNKESEDKKV